MTVIKYVGVMKDTSLVKKLIDRTEKKNIRPPEFKCKYWMMPEAFTLW